MCNEKNVDLANLVAREYAGKNWHTISTIGHEIVEKLVESGHLLPTLDGFVGKMTDTVIEEPSHN